MAEERKEEDKPVKEPKWVKKLKNLISKHWDHHGPSNSINFSVDYDDEQKRWIFSASPVFQEVFGGEDDGKKIWSPFLFFSGKFMQANHLDILDMAFSSSCPQCSPMPKLMFLAKYYGHPLIIQILSEPAAETDVVEILDTVKRETRLKDE